VQLSAPETPGLLRLPNVQHLHTPLEGVLKQTNDICALVAALHPTPATGGLPRETARSLLPTYEDSDRGWYAGPVGWVDGRGGGEFVVAIRSALLRGPEARLYAGCGIVAGSDPEREYAESCLKLKPMLWALNNTHT
jgi:isochorismate synthase EntC